MHQTSAPQSQRLQFQRWWNGNWGELPAWWKPRSRGEYLTAISIPAALGLFYASGQFTLHVARGQTALGIRLLLVLSIVMGLMYAVGIPVSLLVARMSYRRTQRREHHD